MHESGWHRPNKTRSFIKSLSERKHAKWRLVEDTGKHGWNGKHSCFAELNTDRLQTPCLLYQHSHGLTITDTVGALQGTILQDHNFGGSHLYQNSTFSACRTSFPTFTDRTAFPGISRFFVEAQKHKLTSYDFVNLQCVRHTFWSQLNPDEEKPEQYVFPTPYTPITFTDCSFTDLTDETENSEHAGGGALHLFTTSPLLVMGCTFTNCQTAHGSGGAIFIQDRESCPDQIRVESSTFKDCSSPSGAGGGICVIPEVRLELISCTFENCSAPRGIGGAVYADYCTVSLSTFENNMASSGGGLACQSEITIHFCHFEGNQATSGHDFTETSSGSLLPFFGVSFSDARWATQNNLFFVRSDGEDTAPCTFDDPSSRLSTAVGLAPSGVSTEIQVGTGSFGSATLSGTQKVTLNGFFAESDSQMPHPMTSFSIEVKDKSSLTLDTMTLFPLENQPLMNAPSDATNTEIELKHIRLSGSGITAIPFDFHAGTISLWRSCFVSLSDIQCSLISVAGSSSLSISECVFLDIDIKASVISVDGGILQVGITHFRRITRTEGNGAAAIDTHNSGNLKISASFCHCLSVEGVAGALNIASSDVPFVGSFDVLMIGNKGKDDQTAHDIFFSGVTQKNVSGSSFYSCSDQPPILCDGSLEISTKRISYLTVVEDDVMKDILAFTDVNIISPRSLESTDLSALMDQNFFSLELSTSADCVLTFSPLSIQSSRVDIINIHEGIKPILTQTSETDKPLFTIASETGDSVELNMDCVRVILKTQLTAPMISVDAQSSFTFQKSVISSDGGLSQRPFIRSEGSLSFFMVLLIDMSFDGCSCIETTGGNVIVAGDDDMGEDGVFSLSTNVDGAFLSANNTNVIVVNSAFVDCHARNGGAIFTQDCQSEYVVGYFIDCSAEERGGGFCSEHSGSVSEGTTMFYSTPFVNRHAKFGGGFYVTLTPMVEFDLHSMQPTPFFGKYVSFNMFEGCSAEKGAGGYLDGEVGSFERPISTYISINDGSLCEGSDFFISQSLAESIVENGHSVSDFFDSVGSLSSRSESDDGQYKHVEVEEYPELSFNFDFPDIVVQGGSSISLDPCLQDSFNESCNSLSYLINMFHPQTDLGRFLQVPIKLKDTLFIFETARVTKQSIKLILNNEGSSPPERTEIAFGDEHNSETTVFIVIDTSGSVELYELKVDWEEDLTLCQLVDGTASMSILGCEINIASIFSSPLITCQAGILVISDSSFSSTTLDGFNHPLVLSETFPLSPSNSAQSHIIIEMIGVEFQNLKMKDEVAVVELNDADHIKLSKIVFDEVKLSDDSEFPQRGNAPIDALYKSLDKNEEGLPFHTPTLLVYLTKFTAPTIHVQSTGKDVLGCGDATLSCFSLDEADKHLEEALPSSITIHDSAQLSTQLELEQDRVKIFSKGSSCLIEVASTGSLINHKTGGSEHKLELDGLSFELSPGRSKELLQSTGGKLNVSDCSFSWSSELECELALIVGGHMKLIGVNMTRLQTSIPLFRFEGDETARPTASIENCHFSSSAPSLTRSTNDDQNEDENDDSEICWWNSSLILVSKSTLDVSLSSFSDIESGGIMIVNGTVSVYETRFTKSKKEGSGSGGRFGSLARHILCSEGSIVDLKSTTLETALSTSLWINADSSCVVRDIGVAGKTWAGS
ncbi:hypothetical protein BLNAU_5274 [Blattamonas nauphoetae]|uniref:Uncharacterized protein n=1 Tax=Blattamonas nauphoetae TaxID=2049346 RepID=A0ABQ9Y7Q1_9EUKA|nr:hypothetical protein BLNAU_5274 [Blattamonas nauphoetae]